MKATLIFITILLFQSTQILAQPVPPISSFQNPGRGLYISNFFRIITPSPSPTSVNLAPTSVLGNNANTIALLEYCRDNHITHLVLYNGPTILTNETRTISGSGSSLTIADYFCNFINLAKSTYCISNIGVTGDDVTFFDDLRVGGEGTDPIILTNSAERIAVGPDIINLFETQYYPTDSLFSASEYLKYVARILSIFPTALGGGGSPCYHELIDSYVTELEFWRTILLNGPPSCNYDYPQNRYTAFVNLLNYIDNLRDIYNSAGTHSNFLYTEVYLGNLDNWHNTFISNVGGTACIPTPIADPGNNDNHQAIADFIDGNYIGGTTKECDRIFAAYYCPSINDPDKMYNDNQCRDDDFYHERFVDFCNPFNSVNNLNQTDYHPLLHPGFIGNWFNSNTNNIFTAEKDFFDDWANDSDPKVRGAHGNQIDPGGVQWYGSNFLVQYPGGPIIPSYMAHTKTFSTTPVPNTNNINFTYQGPLEMGTKWTFNVDGNTCSTGITGGLTQSNPYNPTVNPINSYVDLSGCGKNLTSGAHSAEMKLEYEFPTGCDYTYTEPITFIPPPYTVTKTSNHSITYAGQPVRFTVTMWNNTLTPITAQINDAGPGFILYNNSIIFSTGTAPSNLTNQYITLQPGMNILTYDGFFQNIGNCAVNTNTFDMLINTIHYPATACVDVKQACPMITYAHGDCDDNKVDFTLGVHTTMNQVQSIDLVLNYPAFLTPPLSIPVSTFPNPIDPSTITSPFAIDYANSYILAAPISIPPIYYNATSTTPYNQVSIHVAFATPINVSLTPPNQFFTLKFDYNSSLRPANTNAFPIFAPTYKTHVVMTSGMFDPLTQASYVYLHGCGDAPYLDKSFVVSAQTCKNPGRVTVTANSTSPTAMHTWDFGDGRRTPVKGAKTFTWDYYAPFTDNFDPTPQPGAAIGNYEFIIKHTIVDNGVFATETQTVFIGPGCCEADIVINGKEVSSTSQLGITSINSKTVDIEGNIDIDNNFLFDGAIVIMEPGSSITIKNGKNVTIRNSHFYGCSAMWKGITLEGDSHLEAIESEFNDADIAFLLKNSTNIYLRNCIIKDNIVGVANEPNSSDEMNFVNYIFDGNTFETTGNFKPNFTGQSAHGLNGKAGIIFNDLGGVIGGKSYERNYFKNLNDGIVLNRCNLTIENNLFDEIHAEDNSSKGAAICSFGRKGLFTIIVNPYNDQKSTLPTINDCDFGVYLNGTGAFVKDIMMEEVQTGIFATRVKNKLRVQAISNSINAGEYGIHYINNEGADKMLAKSNIINFSGATPSGFTYGIACEESGTGVCNFVAFANLITSNGGYGGIVVSGTEQAKILDNIITSTSPSAVNDGFDGISILGTHATLTSCNSISGSNHDPRFPTSGILQSVSSKCLTHCNSVDNTKFGIAYLGPNTDADFKDNSMSNNVTGLHLNSNAVIGLQDKAGNHWYGPFDDGVGFTDGAENLNFSGLNASKFKANASNSILTPSIPVANIGWFQHDAGAEYTCDLGVECTANEEDISEITYLDRMIASGLVNTLDFLSESRDMAKMHLYEKLNEDPSLLSDVILQSFYTALQSSSVKKLTDVKEGIRSLNYYDLFYSNDIRMADSLIKVLNDSIGLIDSIGVKSGFTSLLEIEKKSLHFQINTLENTIKSMNVQREISHSGDKTIVELSNDLIASTEVPEQNKKIINSLHLKTDNGEKNVFNSNQENSLASVAFQCPYAGGEAVYRARVLYKQLHPSVSFNDAAVCLTQGIYRYGESSVTDKNIIGFLKAFTIRPNPAKDNVTIDFINCKECNYKLQILDLNGKLIRQYNLPSEEGVFNFSTTDIESGLYIVKVMNDIEVLGISKLGIIK